ncbi:DUF5685 family protein [Thomasclavelia sp.]|uniref:DUF5685 family protein n=1 Tax=Thomasclavelia sp. TaxID=3025757 RepID=UPI0025D1E0A3|nr:DUF5685 family protein [Thomasclavelia sp.]
MFGYVVVNKPDLTFREFDLYQSYYCGLCKTLKEKYGSKAQISLNFDLNFISILLTGLYEPETQVEMKRCFVHPMKKHMTRYNECVDYAAKMTIVLTYYKCEDDWQDERKLSKQAYKKLINKAYQEVKAEYPNKVAKIEASLGKIFDYEKQDKINFDEISNHFGVVMGEICAYKDDEWYDELYHLGFYLGKFIYFIDAYEDIESDLKKGTFNPFKDLYQTDEFEDKCKEILELMISEATMAFERLPIIENANLIRNILYGGVWTRYMMVKQKRLEGKQ